MGKIKLLPIQEAQKIAAGEVVERPANVIKELLENALDAGATQISLTIEDGGKQLIRIVDNGCGMSPEDARLCILNHATSKISSVDDLETISTFGFRGEALASIASVSHMKIVTKETDASEGYEFIVETGEIISDNPVSCNHGTTIEIRDLFYNVPARKKFLKKRETEWRTIHQIFTAFCLDNRHCSFTLTHDGKQSLYCPAVSTLKERMGQVFDTTLAEHMIECSSEHTALSMTINGVLSRPTHSRYDRNQLILFVNHRWIKNYKLAQAIIKGYSNILPPRRYPTACIFIEIDPQLVDVNIHPRKEEVQFLHPRKVEVALEATVKETLEEHAAYNLGKQTAPTGNRYTHRSALQFSSLPKKQWDFAHQSNENPQPHVLGTKNHFTPSHEASNVKTEHPQYKPLPPNTPLAIQQEHISETQARIALPHAEGYEYRYRLIGQAHNCYIIIETHEGLVMIDQHAAHERILYEQFAECFENVATTQLMFPQLITLSQHDFATLEPHLQFFHKHGILLEQFSETQLTIQALPVHLKNVALEDLIKAAIGWINEFSEIDEIEFLKKMNDNLRTMMACKAAIKAGDKLDISQMNELINKLHVSPNRTTCPHGRPTCWPLTLPEIERKFKRDYKS